MLRRWQHEIANHGGHAGYRVDPLGNSWLKVPVPPIVCEDSCHCFAGPGFFRLDHQAFDRAVQGQRASGDRVIGVWARGELTDKSDMGPWIAMMNRANAGQFLVIYARMLSEKELDIQTRVMSRPPPPPKQPKVKIAKFSDGREARIEDWDSE
jgi:hypothetical protein